MRTLLVDNYDSYTYNLFQVIAEVNGELPVVYYNDKITIDQIQSMVQSGTVHSIVISPGPGTPNNPSDVGVCLDVLRQLTDVPILGICLGHQALAMAHGASVLPAPEPVHGRLSRLRHSGHALFKDIPSANGFEVVRYHSLLVDERSLPECLEAVCWTTGGHSAVKLARDTAAASASSSTIASAAAAAAVPPPSSPVETCAGDASGANRDGCTSSGLEGPSNNERPEMGTVQQQQQQQDEASGCASLLMGLAHRSRPHYGVQFHPESVATRYGIALLRNFRDMAAEHIKRRGGPLAAQLPPVRTLRNIVGPPGRLPALPSWPAPEHQRGATLRLLWSRLAAFLPQLPGGSQAVFELLYGWAEDTFWLDSAAADRGRFSYMGGRGGPLWCKFTYNLASPSPPSNASTQQQQLQPASGDVTSNSNPFVSLDSEDRQPGLPGDQTSTATSNIPAAAAVIASSASCGSGSIGSASSSSSSSLSSTPCCTVATHIIATAAATALPYTGAAAGPGPGGPGGTLTVEGPDGRAVHLAAPSGILAFLQGLLERQRLLVEAEAAAQLPFNFWGGLVGYLGYELKAECGGASAHAATTPDAVMYLADRLIAVDHTTGDVFLMAVYDSAATAAAAGGDGDGSGSDGSAGGDVEYPGERAVRGTGLGQLSQGEVAECVVGRSPASNAGMTSSNEQEVQAQAWLDATRRALEAAVEQVETSASRERVGLTPVAGNPPSSPSLTCPCSQGSSRAAHEEAFGVCVQLAGACGRGATDDGAVAGSGSTKVDGILTTDLLGTPHCSSGLLLQQQQQQQLGTQKTDSVSNPLEQAAAEVAMTPAAAEVVPFILAHGRRAYLLNIAACHAALHAGESYEVCLTTALTRRAAPSPDQLYRTLRQLNPAPYAAWLQCGSSGPTICCSSPERFLRGDRGGLLEARPIKGTAARVVADPEADAAAAAELASSEKERAENLMIVDLLRNDLGRVCEVGSVHVPGLMDIESYATVHQMVSTVRGVRRAGVSIIDCIRAAFPGGSMTGAPKVRTMQIIDALEDRARGIYSGSIGFISFNDTFDLNIVIRTAVIEELSPAPPASFPGGGVSMPARPMDVQPPNPQTAQHRMMTIGAGGAIVVQSQPEAEYDEMQLKARALLRAVALCEGADGPLPLVSD